MEEAEEDGDDEPNEDQMQVIDDLNGDGDRDGSECSVSGSDEEYVSENDNEEADEAHSESASESASSRSGIFNQNSFKLKTT
jgi:hypothetical protein